MNIEKSINVSDNLREGMLAGFEPETAEPEPEEEKTEQESKELVGGDFAKFGQRLRELIRRTGKRTGAVCYEIGISITVWDEYLRGCWLPSEKTAAKMAKYFGVPVAVLLGDEELPEAAEPEREATKAERAAAAGEIAEKARGERLTAARAESVAPALAEIIAGMNESESSGDQAEILMAALTALHRFIPKRVRHSRKGNFCPVCGAETAPICKICEYCDQRLNWELGCGDEVFMRADPDCRFWICGKKENGFLYGYDMNFKMQSEHPDDLVPTGRRCPELARGLEAAARAEMQEGENERL